MNSSIFLEPIIFAALLSASIASIFSFAATITKNLAERQINMQRIKFEKDKLIYSFLKESFDKLTGALDELRNNTQIKNKNPQKFGEELAKANNVCKNIFDRMKPYIEYSKIVKIDNEYKDCANQISELQTKEIWNDEDYKIANQVALNETKLRHQYKDLLEKELIELSQKLYQFKL